MYLNDMASYFVPEFVENMIFYCTVTQPEVFVLFTLYALFIFIFPRGVLRKKVQHASEEKRAIFLQACRSRGAPGVATVSEEQTRDIKETGWFSRPSYWLGGFLVDKLGWLLQQVGNVLSISILAILALLLRDLLG